ncbi:MAG: amino acid carrier protein, partial [Pseudomonadota bacterium]
MQTLEHITGIIAGWAWGPWLLILLIGGGLYFLLRSRFLPFRHLGHGITILLGRYADQDAPGQISHARALSAALAGTIGMGNIAGVALAISIGGPGAIFWMWLTAVVGMATKFFTCTLAVMYRGRDENGQVQGGPMYVITQALPRRWHFLAALFATAGMIGALPALQSNQLVQIIRDLIIIDSGLTSASTDPLWINVACGVVLAVLTGLVVFGGIRRISQVAIAMVPTMSVLYLGTTVIALLLHLDQVGPALALIITDAFTGSAAAGGSLLAVILYGVRRGAYSNEAGIGTEALAHGAARTDQPVREGLVAMIGPIIDTMLVCTATALMILIS